MSSPDLSVIIPVYNRGELIRYTLESVRRAAVGLDVEVIVVDDGSAEPAEASIRSLGFTPQRIIRQDNAGLLFARLAGFAAATGRYTVFLDSDDLVGPDKFRRQLAEMQRSGADVSYSDVAQAVLEGDYDALKFEAEPALRSTADAADFYLRIQPAPHSPIFATGYLRKVVAEPYFPPSPLYNAVAEIWFYHNAAPRPGRAAHVGGPHTIVGRHPGVRLTNHWERLGIASLAVMEAFARAVPTGAPHDRVREIVGEVAFRSWRRLPAGFSPEIARRHLELWRRLSPPGAPAPGGPWFQRLARVVGPERAHRALRTGRARPYREIRTISDEDLHQLLAALPAPVMRRARILIVTSGPLCRNPRPWKEACALGAAGHDVTVLTVAFSERYEAFDRELIAGAPFRKIALSLGAGRAGLPGLMRRAATWLSWRALAAGWQTPGALGPARAMARRAAGVPADLVSVHTELGFFVGSRLLRQDRALLADFEDWHSEDLLPEAQRHRPLGLIRRLEREMMARARAVTAPSQAMADALHAALGGARPAVIRNSFPLQPAPEPRTDGGPPTLFWFSQTVGAGRMLEPFLAAWRLTREPSRLRLLGEVAPAYRAKLLARLPPGRRAALEFLPLISPVELPGVIARHDLGLALEADTPPSRDLTITNKILQYLNAGVGVLATPTAGQREVLDAAPEAGLLLRLQETAQAARAMDELLRDPARRAAMGAAARRAARERFSWEHDAARLQAIVDHALKSLDPAGAR